VARCVTTRAHHLGAHWLYSSDDIVRRQRPPDPFQLELTNRLDLHGVLDLHQDSRGDQDLTRFGFVAEARGDVGHRADSGIIEAALEADCAERSEAVRDPDTEANVMPEAAPRCRQRAESVTHFKRHEHSLKSRVLNRHRIIEHDHHTVASVPLKRAVVFDNDFADCRMVPLRLPRLRSQ
jgi:hypothetical protein